MQRTMFGLACLVGCGGDDAPGARDAAVVVDTTPDAGPNACPTNTSCPCFTNYDCPTGYACVSQDNSGTKVDCLPGTRGTGALGVACTGEADCASALCVDGTNGGLFCSDLCDMTTVCPVDLPSCTFITTFGVSICTP